MIGIRRTAPAAGVRLDAISLDILDVNGEPAMLVRVERRLDSVYALTIADDAIGAIHIVRNPDKLRFLEGQLTRSARFA